MTRLSPAVAAAPRCAVPAPRRGRKPAVLAAVLASALALSACGGAEVVSRDAGFNDPAEAHNRRVHGFNKGVDRVVLRPASQVYGTVVPGPVRGGISNFSDNLGLPAAVVNNLLQGRIEPAGKNGFRFLVNSTFGLGGFLDPATDMGLTEEDTDFGETLHVWGAGEGFYMETPLRGPSTVRDTVGAVVDIFLDPVNSSIDRPESNYVLGANGLSLVGDRYRYSDTIDSLLYESADSYAQARLLYLQNRRFELGTEAESNSDDPYDDPYGQ
nr:VacJ family lipoprotein [Frigidibacter albus]